MNCPDLVKIFDEAMVAPEFPPDPSYKPKKKFKPSVLGTPCLRKIFYSYMKVEPDYKVDFQGALTFKLGDFYGGVLVDMYRKAGILVDYLDPKTGKYRDHMNKPGFDLEFPVVDYDIEITWAKIDAVLVIDGKIWLGEFKSIKDDKWKWLKEAKPEHKVQGGLYLYLFKESMRQGKFKHIPQLKDMTADDVEGIIFLYWNKGTNERRQFVHTDLEKEFEATIQKIFEVKDHVKRNELPKKTEDFCNWCEFRDRCSREYKPECK